MEFLNTKEYSDNFEILKYAVKSAYKKNDKNDLFLEFGVFNGTTINFISNLIKNKTVYGFDSFIGLPEDWRGSMTKGFFDRGGVLPEVNQNVNLISGWFKDVLPSFLSEHPDKNISFIHMDCDIYSSTKDVLYHCHDKIKKGTLILFDEFYNYPEWEEHEYKAWNEYVDEYNINYEYLGHTNGVNHFQQVLLRIL